MLRRCLLLWGLVCFLGTEPVSAQEKVFKAGAFAQDITPVKFPISVNGGMSDRSISKAHDRLHARCLVLDDGTTRIAFAVCDSCMIPRDVTDAARELVQKAVGIPAQHILISATHTHSAPTVTGVFQSDPDEGYREYLKGKIADGIIRAFKNLEPAQIGWGVAKNPNQVFNRRWKTKRGSVLLTDPFGKGTDKVRMNPGYKHPDLIENAGPVDPDVSVVSVRSAKGKPLALLANYSLHYVGGFPDLSADYFGAFAEKIQSLVDGDKAFVGIMSNGTSGDINNVNFAMEAPKGVGPGERIRIVADSVAQTAFEAYKKIQHQPWVPLDAKVKELELGVRLPDAEELARAEEILAKNKKLTTQPQIYARETVLIAKYPARVKLLVQALRIGGLGIAAAPCETFVEIGLEIKKKSPSKQTFTISLANGYNGYLPTPEQHALGGYETWRARSSYLEVNASRTITDTVLTLLAETNAR